MLTALRMHICTVIALARLFYMITLGINRLVSKPTMIFFLQLSFSACLLSLLEISHDKSLWRRQGEMLHLSLIPHSSWGSMVLLLSVN